MKNLQLTFLLVIFGTPIMAANSSISLKSILNHESNFTDSLGTVNISGTLYIKHKVKAGETLYSLLRRYQCSNADAQRANAALAGGNTIYVNQILRFPSQTASGETVSAEPIVQEISTVTTVHSVGANETLYSIGTRYNMDIDSLKRINNLTSNSISVGQRLMVRQLASNIDHRASPAAEEVRHQYPDDLVPEKFVVPNAPMGKKVSELGIVEVIATSKKSNQRLALHKTAPLGSLITVKNVATGNRIVVKVIGKLPNTGVNDNVLVRLSPAAFYKLNPKDIRIRAEVVYFNAPEIASSK